MEDQRDDAGIVYPVQRCVWRAAALSCRPCSHLSGHSRRKTLRRAKNINVVVTVSLLEYTPQKWYSRSNTSDMNQNKTTTGRVSR